MWVLLERPGIPGRVGSYVRCPMCRANTMVQDISYVSTVRQLAEEDKDLIVQVKNIMIAFHCISAVAANCLNLIVHI